MVRRDALRSSEPIGWAAAFGIALTVAALACGGASPKAQRAHGVVESVDAAARKVTLDHQDIPGLMRAMTMTFDVAPGVALEDLRPGVEVDFWVSEVGGVYTVMEIRRSGSQAELEE